MKPILFHGGNARPILVATPAGDPLADCWIITVPQARAVMTLRELRDFFHAIVVEDELHRATHTGPEAT